MLIVNSTRINIFVGRLKVERKLLEGIFVKLKQTKLNLCLFNQMTENKKENLIICKFHYSMFKCTKHFFLSLHAIVSEDGFWTVV